MHISSSYAKILGEKLFHTREIPRSGSKAEDGEKEKKERKRDRTMVITMAKLRMAHASTHGARKPPGPKYWGGNYFAHGSFPKVGQKQKTERKKEREKKRPNDGNNNGQATNGARKHAWRTQAAWANIQGIPKEIFCEPEEKSCKIKIIIKEAFNDYKILASGYRIWFCQTPNIFSHKIE